MKLVEKPESNFNCPSCDENFRFTPPPLGDIILCPNCNDPLSLLDEGYTENTELEEPDSQLGELIKSVDDPESELVESVANVDDI